MKKEVDQLQPEPSVSSCFELDNLPKLVVSSALPLAPTAVICLFTIDLPQVAAPPKYINGVSQLLLYISRS